MEYETYDSYSRYTVSVDKNELSILIESLKSIEKKSSDVFTDKTGFKFVTQKYLEFGSIYDVLSKKWNHYILFPDRHIIQYNSLEMKDLITLLTKVEKEL